LWTGKGVKDAGSKKCKEEEGNADEEGKDGLAEGKKRVGLSKIVGSVVTMVCNKYFAPKREKPSY